MKAFQGITLCCCILLFSYCYTEGDSNILTAEDSLSFSSTKSSSSSSSGSSSDTISIDPGQITSAEWNDQLNWEFWLGLMQKSEYFNILNEWEIQPTTRFAIEVLDLQSNPCIDCTVELHNGDKGVIWTAKTDNFGSAELWSNIFDTESLGSYSINIDCNGYTNAYPLYNSGQIVNHIALPIISTNPDNVDVAFVFDATGSMGDELEYLKVEIEDVLNTVSENDPYSYFRYASVFYRDQEDDYVTKFNQFDSDALKLVNFISDQSAGGGGDYPEAVHEALKVSVEDLSWSETAKTRLLFLILDAPPHDEYTVIQQLKEYTQVAAALGVKIIPVSASGVNKTTEFLLRALALATNGTYTFVTDHSGIGNDHLEPTTGDYEIEYLNEMIIRLVNHYSQ